MIDLHMHSTASDGSLQPADLVREAVAAGVTRLALTDHDCISGLAEARAEARKQGISFLGGVEISAEYAPGAMHLLGYGFKEFDPALDAWLLGLRRAREERNPKIACKLRELGMDVTMGEVFAVAGGEVVGRPHFARVLVEKKYAESVQQAFDRFLTRGGPAYVDKVRLDPGKSISAIRESGGIAVLAHPKQLKARGPDGLEAVVKELVDSGLQGLECFYKDHSVEDEKRFLALAEKFRLVPTGGSDFHGSNSPGVRPGTGHGAMRVPSWCWERLMALLA